MNPLPSLRFLGNPVSPLLASLAGYYRLEEASGTRVDSSGNGNNLAPTNTPGDAAGIIGNGLALVATSSQYVSGTVGSGTVTKLTISFWANRASSADNIVVGWGATLNHRFEMGLLGGGTSYAVAGSGADAFGAFTDSSTGWHHYVMVYDGSQSTNATKVIVYEDGVQVTLGFTGTIPASYVITGAFNIGAELAQSFFTKGTIDEVGVWVGRALDSNSVAQLYGGGTPPHFPFITVVDPPIINTTNISVPSGGLPLASWVNDNTLAEDFTFLMHQTTLRLRQNIFVGGARIRLNGNTTTPSIKFKVFRYNGSTYDYIDGTDWLGPIIAGDNTYLFPTPITCAMGDYFAVVLKAGSGIAMRCATAGAGSTIYAAGDITGTNAFSSNVAFNVDMEALTRPVILAVCGDSIPSGFNGAFPGQKWYTVEDGLGPDGDITSEPAHQMVALLGAEIPYQNHAKAGSTYADQLATLVPNALLCLPTILYIECGTNDINTGRTWPQVESDLNAIKALLVNGEQLFIGELPPWTNGTDLQSATLRTFNANIATWCAANGATRVLLHDAMGQLRVSTGFLDDLKTAYNQDGVHLTNPAGVDAIALLWKTGMGLT
jgi:hypothetical protein